MRISSRGSDRWLIAAIGVLVLAVAPFGGCKRSEPPPAATAAAPSKDPERARALIAAGAVVIDVRTPDEFAAKHVPNAVNLPVQDLPSRLGEVEQLVAGDKTRPIVVYCAAGGRAAKAKQALEAAGFGAVVNGGGVDQLVAP